MDGWMDGCTRQIDILAYDDDNNNNNNNIY
jgi:hypothetical protein